MLGKGDWFRILILVFLLIMVPNFNFYVSDLVTAKMAVAQLEDSDVSYLTFQASKSLPTILWLITGAWAGYVLYRIIK